MKKLTILTSLFLFSLAATAQVETPTMGWSSWNTFSVQISEDIIKGQADAMVNQGLKDVGYIYINIDDGFQYGRTSEGKVRIHPERFPNGLRVVSDYIHSLGLKAGIYSDAGDCTCGSISNGDVLNTNVGFYGHEQVDADFYFLENDFDFIKVDYCGGNHANLNEQAQYTKIGNAIKNTGKDVRYNLCRWAYPGKWAHDVATSWRTTGDIYDGWESVKGILAENLYMSAYCYGGCYNDMDMLEVGRSMTAIEDATHFGMWCIMASPLLIGCNMETIRPAALELLKNKELIALNQDPLGLQAYVVQHNGDTYVLAKDLETMHGTARAFALYNPSDKDQDMTITASELDLAGKATVRHLLAHNNVLTDEDFHSLTVRVPAHGAYFFRVDAEKRLERYIYEGETAFLNDYQEIYNHEAVESAIYQGGGNASGGMYAGWLGHKRSNYLEWKDVYSQEGGEYVAHIRVATQENRSFTVCLNGTDVQTVSAQTGNWDTFKEYDINLTLQPGSNSVVLYNEVGWMPNVDCMTIEKVGSTTILDRRLEELTWHLKETGKCTQALGTKAGELLTKAASDNLTVAEKETLIKDMENLLAILAQVKDVVNGYFDWWQNMEANIEVSIESAALSTLKEKMLSAQTSLDDAETTAAATRAFTNLKTAYRAYLKAADAQPLPGKSFDMTYLITNFDFSANDGWSGSPTYRSGCGEEYNNTFDMYQTITGMKPGVYTLTCNALYRTGDNDGGAAYKAGTEVIPAELYAANESVPVVSLYSEEWPEAGNYGHVDNLNGYPHSMYAAGLRFADGFYKNELVFTIESKQNVRFGLRSSVQKQGCWCCFDNFSLSYKPLADDNAVRTVTVPFRDEQVYDLQGRPTTANAKGIKVKKGRKSL